MYTEDELLSLSALQHLLFCGRQAMMDYFTENAREDKTADKQKFPQLIPPHGGYRELQSYQMSGIVYDATVVFFDQCILKRSRTHDQMV